MVKVIESTNLELLDVVYNPLPNLLKSEMIEHNMGHSWDIQTGELQLTGGNYTPRNSNIVHLQNLMNITINLVKYGHQVQNT